MKGMKAVEYKIWARSLKYKMELTKMTKARDILRKLRRVRASTELWEPYKD